MTPEKREEVLEMLRSHAKTDPAYEKVVADLEKKADTFTSRDMWESLASLHNSNSKIGR